MSETQRKDDLLVAVALTLFHHDFREADPELAEQAWQLAADRLLEHDVGPREVVDELEIGEGNSVRLASDSQQTSR